MADEKWSEFPAASSVADADYTAVVQGGVNKRGAMSVLKSYIQAAFNSIYVALTRTLTIGGTAQTLASDRSWTTNTILEGLGSPVQGVIMYRGSANWVLLTPSTDGNVLTTHGSSSNPTWTTPTAGAPTTAHFLTSQSESSLSNEVNLGALATGILKGTVSAGVSTISAVVDSTVGGNLVTLSNPSAITFIRINADNSVSALDASTFRTAIGAGTGGGDVSSNTSTSVDSEIALFNSATGKSIKRATGSGIAELTSGVLSISGLSTVATFGQIELGNTDTSISRSSAGHIAVEGHVLLDIETAQSATLKRIIPRTHSTASATSWTPDFDTYDQEEQTALAGACTINAPTYSNPNNGEKRILRIKDNGTARALTFNAAFRFSSDLPAPSTTVLSKTLYIGFEYNSVGGTWDCLAVINNF